MNILDSIATGNKLLDSSEFIEAQTVFAEAMKSFPDNAAVKERYAHVAMRMGDLVQAYERYQNLRDSHPNNPVGMIGLGNVLLQSHKMEEAQEVFATALETFPGNAWVKERNAHVAVRLGDLDRARLHYQDMKANHPEVPSGYIGLGNLSLQADQLEDAQRLFTEALEKFPENIWAKERCAHVAMRLGNLDQAREHFQDLKDNHPDHPAGFIGLGNMALRSNDLDAAQAIFAEALEQFPQHETINERSAHVALRLGDLAKAQSQYQALKERFPRNPAGFIGLATVLQQSDKLPEAKKMLAEAIKLFPANATLQSQQQRVIESIAERKPSRGRPSATAATQGKEGTKRQGKRKRRPKK